MIFRIAFFMLFVCFVGACTHKTNEYSLDGASTLKIDESQLVLTRFPSEMRQIGDSIVAVINSSQNVSLYNIYSGKNTINLSLQHINFDSLIQNTFQKKHIDSKKYVYTTGYELNGENYQITAFDYSNKHFWIHTSVIVEVHNLKESAESLKKHMDNEKIKELSKHYDSINIIEMDYLNFVFETDENLRIKTIIPMYGDQSLKENNYYPYYNKHFFVADNDIYVPIGRMNESFNQLESKMNIDPINFCLAKISLTDEKKIDFRLSFSNVNFKDYTLRHFIEARYRFYSYKNKMLFSNGRGIYEVESEKNVFDTKYLSKNEWIAEFHIADNNCLIMITYEADATQPNYKIKIFDMNSLEWKKEQPIEVLSSTMTITENKVFYLSRDKENYFFNCITYHEK